MQGVVIDTSAWIDFFRSGNGKVADSVARLIDADQAIMVGPVMTELLRGVRSDKESHQLKTLLAALPYVEVVREDWEVAGNTLQKLRTCGVTLPLTDVLIATVASRHRLPVLTLDKDFNHLPVDRFQMD